MRKMHVVVLACQLAGACSRGNGAGAAGCGTRKPGSSSGKLPADVDTLSVSKDPCTARYQLVRWISYHAQPDKHRGGRRQDPVEEGAGIVVGLDLGKKVGTEPAMRARQQSPMPNAGSRGMTSAVSRGEGVPKSASLDATAGCGVTDRDHRWAHRRRC